MAEYEDFKFPDEKSEEIPDVVVDTEDDIKVEIVDDTPPEDRGRQPLPKEMVEELDKDDLEEYSDKVKKRLSQMKKVWHDERREKERAAREREEAFALAQRIHQENQTLKQRLSAGEKIFVTEITKAAETEAATAEEKLKQAYEAGDAERLTAAQKALMEATLKLRDAKQFRPSLQNEEEGVQRTSQAEQQWVPPDSKAEAWRKKNPWFGVDGN